MTLLSDCLASGYIVLSTVPVTFWSVAQFHTSIRDNSIFFQGNLNRLMSGAGEEFCEDSFHSKNNGTDFYWLFFLEAFPLSTIKNK